MIGPPSGFNHTRGCSGSGWQQSSRYQHEQRSDTVQLVDFDRLTFTTQRFNHHTVEAFTCARVVTEEGFGDSDNRDNRSHPRDNRCVKVVSQVRQNRDVLLFSRSQSAGVRLSTQLKTKNITVSTIMMCANARS